jgi:hypothetical protein
MMAGGDNENSIKRVDRHMVDVGLHQQQRSFAAGEDHGGRTAELRDDGRLSGRNEASLQLSG